MNQDELASALSCTPDLETKIKIVGNMFANFSMDELEEKINYHSSNGYQGPVGEGYRTLSRILFQLF